MNNPYVICPYDRSHRVLQSRIQRHLMKCERRYPPLAICPYNHTHRFPQDALPAHVVNCPSKDPIFPEEKHYLYGKDKKPIKPETPWIDPDEEVWF